MSTPQSIPHAAPWIGLGTVLIALGVLLAIAVTITILALTANQTTVATPVTASQAAADSTPQTYYLGPRQERAAINYPQSGDGTSPAAGAGNPAAHYACLGAAARCLR